MRTLFTILIASFVCVSFTDDPIKLTVKDVLSNIPKERLYVQRLQTLDFVNSMNYRLPILSELGFRYGADDITTAKQQFATTLSFNSLKKIKEQESIKKAQVDLYAAKKDVILNTVLRDCYKNIVDVYFSQNIVKRHSDLENLLQQRNTVLKMALQKGLTIKVKDLVETEEDLKSLILEQTEWNNIQATGLQRIKDYMGGSRELLLVFDNFISFKKVESLIQTIKNNRNLRSPELKVREGQINLAQAELRLEQADFKQVFDNVQFIYQTKSNKEISLNDFSMRVGFNIPLKGNLRPKQNELLLDIKEAENGYSYQYFETERKIKLQVITVENLLKQYRQNLDKLENSLAKTLLNTPSVSATLTATDIVDLKIIQQKKEIDLTQIHYKLMQEFINLLDLTGDLMNSPHKNYLSENLESW